MLALKRALRSKRSSKFGFSPATSSIPNKYNEVNEYNKKADEEKQKIINESQEIQNNLDYINNKYK